MAAFQMPLDPNDPDFRRVRVVMSPRAVVQIIDGVLSTLWMTLPANERRLMLLESAARVMLVEVVELWRSLEPGDRASHLERESNALSKDLATGGEAELVTPEGSAEINFPFFFNADLARHQLFTAFVMAQFLLPPDRQDDAAVETYIRKVFERQLGGWWEDARDLDIGIAG